MTKSTKIALTSIVGVSLFLSGALVNNQMRDPEVRQTVITSEPSTSEIELLQKLLVAANQMIPTPTPSPPPLPLPGIPLGTEFHHHRESPPGLDCWFFGTNAFSLKVYCKQRGIVPLPSPTVTITPSPTPTVMPTQTPSPTVTPTPLPTATPSTTQPPRPSHVPLIATVDYVASSNCWHYRWEKNVFVLCGAIPMRKQ